MGRRITSGQLSHRNFNNHVKRYNRAQRAKIQLTTYKIWPTMTPRSGEKIPSLYGEVQNFCLPQETGFFFQQIEETGFFFQQIEETGFFF